MATNMANLIDYNITLSAELYATVTSRSPQPTADHYLSINVWFHRYSLLTGQSNCEQVSGCIVPRSEFFNDVMESSRCMLSRLPSTEPSPYLIKLVASMVAEIYHKIEESPRMVDAGTLDLSLRCFALVRDQDITREQALVDYAARREEANEDSDSECQTIPADEAAVEALAEVEESGIDCEDRDSKCTICFEEFDCTEDTFIRMPCSHVFHKDCLVKWLETSHSCPMCRFALPISIKPKARKRNELGEELPNNKRRRGC